MRHALLTLRPAGYARSMVPAGDPGSFLTLEPGADVFASDGERVGAVEHVLRDEMTAIFDGIVIDIRTGPGGLRFVDAPDVGAITDGAVTLTIAAADVDALPNPEPNPAVMENHGVEDSESPLQHKLSRAWDIISGRG
jgi:hypothetical protein